MTRIPPPSGNPSIELWLQRRLAGRDGPQTTVVDHLRRLEDAGVIDRVSVRHWGTHVALEATGEDAVVVERVEAFEDWADRTGRDLPAFGEVEPICRGRQGSVTEARRLPQMALAEYRDGDLYWVAPCEDEGTTHGVTDRLLDLGDPPEWLAEGARSSASSVH